MTLFAVDAADSGEVSNVTDTWVPELAQPTTNLSSYARNLPPTRTIRRHTDEHAAIEIPATIGIVDTPPCRCGSLYVRPVGTGAAGRHRARSLAGPLAGFATFLAAAALILWVVTW
jgi:hypothetical protein